jgi:hypothetical protein
MPPRKGEFACFGVLSYGDERLLFVAIAIAVQKKVD